MLWFLLVVEVQSLHVLRGVETQRVGGSEMTACSGVCGVARWLFLPFDTIDASRWADVVSGDSAQPT